MSQLRADPTALRALSRLQQAIGEAHYGRKYDASCNDEHHDSKPFGYATFLGLILIETMGGKWRTTFEQGLQCDFLVLAPSSLLPP